MIGRFLRHLLEPLTITTAPAPVLAGGHVDVTADAASITESGCTYVPPAPVGGSGQARATVSPLRVEGSISIELDDADSRSMLDFIAGQPSIDRGVCYHHLHFDYDGRRFGAPIHEHQHSATLLPCPYVGKGGR